MKESEPGSGEGHLLKQRFEGKRGLRAQLARDYASVGLSESLISQHLTGNRPISLKMAVIYARALACTLDDISPSWAAAVRAAASALRGSPLPDLPPMAVSDAAGSYFVGPREKKRAELADAAARLGDAELEYLIAKARAIGGPEIRPDSGKKVGNGL